MFSTVSLVIDGAGRVRRPVCSSLKNPLRPARDGQAGIRIFLLVFFALLFFSWSRIGFAANAGDNAVEMTAVHLMRPVALAPNAAAQFQLAEDDTEPERRPWVKRVGGVALDVERLLPRSPTSGKREAAPDSFQQRVLVLDLFPDRGFDVVVDRESHPQTDTLSIIARIEGAELATVTLTVTSESYILEIQDLENAVHYRVVGGTETGEGRVTEIDLTKLPPILYSPPVIPSVQ
jgi:hypothetical protein